ncbi:DUF2130 domain-containing protein [Spirulina major]|uniref:DUF2130 domain-containing protein n=1 Tax=Spirulina major TaxID=270636 RepID=UPI0009327F2C|nr:DUF2130 domain-containing protein [Spirulina major]
MPAKTPKVTCPSCSHTFDLSETVQDFLSREKVELQKKLDKENEKQQKKIEQEYQEKLDKSQAEQRQKSQELTQAQAALEVQKRQLQAEKDEQAFTIQKQVSEILEQERVKQLAKQKKLEQEYQEKLDKSQAEQRQKSQELTQAQAALEVQKRQLQAEKEEQALTIQKQVSEILEQERVKQLANWKEQAYLEVQEDYKQKSLSKDLKIEELTEQLTRTQKSLEDAQQKSTQGSTELEGEALENLALKTIKSTFPTDKIDKTTKGAHGVDLYQSVMYNGQNCGLIVHEIKNTKNYQKDWIPKLKKDIVEKKATCAVLLTKTMPDGVEAGFKFEDNILIVDWFSYRLAVSMLRNQMIKIQEKSQSIEIGNRYALDLWTYVNGADFANQLEHVITRQKNAQKQFDAMRKKFATFEQSFANAIQAQEDLIGRLGAFTMETEILELPEGE